MSATMKLDEMMAGLEEFLNSPPAKRKKVYFKQQILTWQILTSVLGRSQF